MAEMTDAELRAERVRVRDLLRKKWDEMVPGSGYGDDEYRALLQREEELRNIDIARERAKLAVRRLAEEANNGA